MKTWERESSSREDGRKLSREIVQRSQDIWPRVSRNVAPHFLTLYCMWRFRADKQFRNDLFFLIKKTCACVCEAWASVTKAPFAGSMPRCQNSDIAIPYWWKNRIYWMTYLLLLKAYHYVSGFQISYLMKVCIFTNKIVRFIHIFRLFVEFIKILYWVRFFIIIIHQIKL